MSTKLQKEKRLTKQVRVDLRWHRWLKLEAAKKGIVISRLLDEIFNLFMADNSSK